MTMSLRHRRGATALARSNFAFDFRLWLAAHCPTGASARFARLSFRRQRDVLVKALREFCARKRKEVFLQLVVRRERG